MSVFYHQRQCSGNEQLIAPPSITTTDESNDDSVQPVYCNPTTSLASEIGPQRPLCPPASGRTNQNTADMRFSTLSDCSSYYGLPDSPNENQSRHILKDPYLRANFGVVLGSFALTLVGSLLIGFGLFVTFVPNELDIHGFVFLVVGVLFFIPGFYHLFYILCALCGRAGYSFENLPTFNRPT